MADEPQKPKLPNDDDSWIEDVTDQEEAAGSAMGMAAPPYPKPPAEQGDKPKSFRIVDVTEREVARGGGFGIGAARMPETEPPSKVEKT